MIICLCFLCLSGAVILSRVASVMSRTGGVAHEVNRFLIEYAGDAAKYDRKATHPCTTKLIVLGHINIICIE
jgi:hypothetical protein